MRHQQVCTLVLDRKLHLHPLASTPKVRDIAEISTVFYEHLVGTCALAMGVVYDGLEPIVFAVHSNGIHTNCAVKDWIPKPIAFNRYLHSLIEEITTS